MRRRQIFAAMTEALNVRPVEPPMPVPVEFRIPLGEVEDAPIDPHACPKCGRVVRKGKHFHQKYCRGVKADA